MTTTEDEDWGKVSDLSGPKLVVVLNRVLESKALDKLGSSGVQGKLYANKTKVRPWRPQNIVIMNFAGISHYNCKLGLILSPCSFQLTLVFSLLYKNVFFCEGRFS